MEGAIAAGGAAELLFLLLIFIFRRFDKESGLPTPSYRWIVVSYIFPSIAWVAGAGIGSIFFFIYLAVNAYTDRYTQYLYVVLSRTYLSAGLIFLLLEGYQYRCLLTVCIGLLLWIVWVLVCYLVCAINNGDVELLITAAVWLLLVILPVLADRGMTGFFLLLFIPITAYVAACILALLCNLKSAFQRKRVAFAPYVLAGNFMMLLWTYLAIKK